MSEFRFESLDIWKRGIEIDDKLFEIADRAEKKRYYRYAEQLRAAASMSICNNIAEGSGSFSNKDFAHFIVIARKSIFECANILVLFLRKEIIDTKEKNELYTQLDSLSKMMTNFRKYLLKK